MKRAVRGRLGRGQVASRWQYQNSTVQSGPPRRYVTPPAPPAPLAFGNEPTPLDLSRALRVNALTFYSSRIRDRGPHAQSPFLLLLHARHAIPAPEWPPRPGVLRFRDIQPSSSALITFSLSPFEILHFIWEYELETTLVQSAIELHDGHGPSARIAHSERLARLHQIVADCSFVILKHVSWSNDFADMDRLRGLVEIKAASLGESRHRSRSLKVHVIVRRHWTRCVVLR